MIARPTSRGLGLSDLGSLLGPPVGDAPRWDGGRVGTGGRGGKVRPPRGLSLVCAEHRGTAYGGTCDTPMQSEKDNK